MGIKRIEVYSVELYYNEPFRISAGASEKSSNVVVKMTTDYGVVGWGESSPSQRVTGENQQTVIDALDKIAPKLIGKCPLRIEHDVELMDSIVKEQPAAKAAVDIALHDILGKTVKKPLFMLMGGYRTKVFTDITLGIKSPKEMVEDAVKAVNNGFKALKVKVGVDPVDDVQRIRQIRTAVGDEIEIRIDANQGWTAEQAIQILNRIERFNIKFIEQPVPADDIRGLAQIRKESSIPVMADESIHSPEDAFKLIQREAVDMVNIKLMKSGGIFRGRKIAEVAEAAGVPCMIGCMGESEIGIAAGVHLAAAIRNIQFADLDSDLLLREGLVKKKWAEIEDSTRAIPEKSGLGIEDVNLELLGHPKKIYK
ncbi:MAG: dipeptide epimerase [Candidatus Bathyarchaeota archaeon]